MTQTMNPLEEQVTSLVPVPSAEMMAPSAIINAVSSPVAAPAAGDFLTGRLTGRGIYYGAGDQNGRNRVFSRTAWDATCATAAGWGMRYVHPKVADGTQHWYPDAASMLMLKEVAAGHGLVCAPYMYCYGNHYGALAAEATLAAQLGALFGIIILDIEVEWNDQKQWAIDYGRVLDAEIARLGKPVEIYPDLFPNPAVQSTPYEEILAWKHVRGWRPMVYFSVWETLSKQDTAQQAYDYVEPMWQALNARLEARHIAPPPIYPIIEVAGLPFAEVAAWAVKMQYYGYLAYWYDTPYPAYARIVLDAPIPRWRVDPPPAPTPAPVPTKPVNPVVVIDAPPIVAPPVQFPPIVPPVEVLAQWGNLLELAESGLQIDKLGVLRQPLTTEQAAVLWHLSNPQQEWNPQQKLTDWWVVLTALNPEMLLGVPTGSEITRSVDGVEVKVLPLSSGRALVWFSKDSRAFLV